MQLHYCAKTLPKKKKNRKLRRLLQKENCHDRHKSRSRVPTRKIQSTFRNHTGTWRETKRVKCLRYGKILKSTEKSLSHISYHRKRSFRFGKNDAAENCFIAKHKVITLRNNIYIYIYTTGASFRRVTEINFIIRKKIFLELIKKSLCLRLKWVGMNWDWTFLSRFYTYQFKTFAIWFDIYVTPRIIKLRHKISGKKKFCTSSIILTEEWIDEEAIRKNFSPWNEKIMG